MSNLPGGALTPEKRLQCEDILKEVSLLIPGDQNGFIKTTQLFEDIKEVWYLNRPEFISEKELNDVYSLFVSFTYILRQSQGISTNDFTEFISPCFKNKEEIL